VVEGVVEPVSKVAQKKGACQECCVGWCWHFLEVVCFMIEVCAVCKLVRLPFFLVLWPVAVALLAAPPVFLELLQRDPPHGGSFFWATTGEKRYG